MKHDYRSVRRRSFGKYRLRCSHCEKRRTSSRHPDQASRTTKCDSCGRRKWRVDWYRTTKIESHRTTCKCGGMPWPHRKSSCYTLIEEQPFRCSSADRDNRIQDRLHERLDAQRSSAGQTLDQFLASDAK